MKGFEPLNVGSKFRCLTTWLHPIIFQKFLLKPSPQVGIEPTTRWLTAICSTSELLEIYYKTGVYLDFDKNGKKKEPFSRLI